MKATLLRAVYRWFPRRKTTAGGAFRIADRPTLARVDITRILRDTKGSGKAGDDVRTYSSPDRFACTAGHAGVFPAGMSGVWPATGDRRQPAGPTSLLPALRWRIRGHGSVARDGCGSRGAGRQTRRCVARAGCSRPRAGICRRRLRLTTVCVRRSTIPQESLRARPDLPSSRGTSCPRMPDLGSRRPEPAVR